MSPNPAAAPRLGALLLGAAAAVLLAGLAEGAWAARHCSILQYHHVSAATPRATSVTPAQLEAHLGHLEDEGFQVLDLEAVASAVVAGEPLPERCVALTFDDAYRSVYEEAFPRIRRRGWPMTVFVSTGVIDAGGDTYLSWEQMREMAGAGVRFANHSHGHGHLVRQRPGESAAAWIGRVREDLLTALARLRAELGSAPALFAWPYGEYVPALGDLVRELGLIGFGQQSGPASPHARPYALPRFAMAAPYAGLEGFALKLRTLPLPVVAADPESPVVAPGVRRPTLRVRLDAPPADPEALRCWVNGTPDTTVAWPRPDTFTVTATRDLPVGRSRYNCTMPARESGRWHWHSQPWLRRHDDGL